MCDAPERARAKSYCYYLPTCWFARWDSIRATVSRSSLRGEKQALHDSLGMSWCAHTVHFSSCYVRTYPAIYCSWITKKPVRLVDTPGHVDPAFNFVSNMYIYLYIYV